MPIQNPVYPVHRCKFKSTFALSKTFNTQKIIIMKPLLFIPLGICLATTGCYAAAPAAPKVLLAQAAIQDHSQQIAQIKAGTLKTADASWWGFSSDDATDCLQNAINSGVPKLIVDNTGSDWIINKPLSLVSNQEIIFSDGVVILAKKDCFHGTNDSLFQGSNLTNLTMRGEGKAILQMQKADYQNPAKYSRAEWRMGIKLSDCTNVVISNFTVTKTGGDGLYLGGASNGSNKNVLVENMNFDDNHRLGMAVISVDGLTIRNCKFVNTLGTPPNGGIDFEPNTATQQLTNIDVEDCIFDNNISGSGIDISPAVFTADTQPISITFKRCHMGGNAQALTTTPSTSKTIKPVTGKVTFINCTFDHNKIVLRDPVQNGLQLLFQNCTLDFSPIAGATTPDWKSTPITIACTNPPPGYEIGGVAFDHTTVIDDSKNPPIEILFQGPGELSNDITGDILVKRTGKTTPFDLATFVKNTEAGHQKLNAEISAQKPAMIALDALKAPAAGAPRKGNNEFYVQGDFTFLQYATKGETVTIDVTVRKVYPRETTVDLIDPSGKKIETYTIPLTNKPFPITFTAGETGLYRVARDTSFSQRVDITSANPGNGLLVNKQIAFLPLEGRLYFQVPAGVKTFSIGVSTATSADVALLNPEGKEVQRHDNLKSMDLFSATRTDESKSEIWSISVANAVWVVYVHMYAPLVPVVSTNPETLLQVK
jgi:hypothetical protein